MSMSLPRWAWLSVAAAVFAGCAPTPVFDVECRGGRAERFPCFNIDLGAYLPLHSIGNATSANDIWGYADPESGRELALIGLSTGTGFVDVTDPDAPIHLGELPAPGLSATTFGQSKWRDVKVMGTTAIVVTESEGSGAQLIDLQEVLDADPDMGPHRFVESALYGNEGEPEPEPEQSAAMALIAGAHPQGPRVPAGLKSAVVANTHNVAVNEETQYAYLVGTNSCGGGLHMVDVSDVSAPVFAGCFSDEGYTHDVQCVVYRGGDADYFEREVCFALNGQVGDTITTASGDERTLTRGDSALVLVDVTDKANPQRIARVEYPGAAYAHQGWLTGDHRYLLSNDELDEVEFGHNTSTYVWDLADLDAPRLVGTHEHDTQAIDHNLFVRGNLVFETNYSAGLRVLETTDLPSAQLTEVAYFDTFPDHNDAVFVGTWSSYPYLPSGNIIVSSIDEGLFVLKPRL